LHSLIHLYIQSLLSLMKMVTRTDWRLLSDRSGYYTGYSLPTAAALCEQAAEQLFHSIKHTPTHHLSLVHHTSSVPV